LPVQAIGNFNLSNLAFCELNRTDRRRRRKRTLFSLAICETQKRMKISDFRFQHNYNRRRDYTDVIVLSKHKVVQGDNHVANVALDLHRAVYTAFIGEYWDPIKC
jgi:hypothetical protein